jgi:hypothetical protein
MDRVGAGNLVGEGDLGDSESAGSVGSVVGAVGWQVQAVSLVH